MRFLWHGRRRPVMTARMVLVVLGRELRAAISEHLKKEREERIEAQEYNALVEANRRANEDLAALYKTGTGGDT
jgi:hypothetical protein